MYDLTAMGEDRAVKREGVRGKGVRFEVRSSRF